MNQINQRKDLQSGILQLLKVHLAIFMKMGFLTIVLVINYSFQKEIKSVVVPSKNNYSEILKIPYFNLNNDVNSVNPHAFNDTTQKSIDSLLTIFRKKFKPGQNGDKTQVRFMKACYALGQYYEREFDKGRLPNMKKALFYYEKAADLTAGVDSDLGDTDNQQKYDLWFSIKTHVAEIYYQNKGGANNKERVCTTQESPT